MAEVVGDLGERDSFIKHVGGVAVTKGVDDDALVTLEKAGAGEGNFEAGPCCAGAHGFFVLTEVLA